MKKPSAPATTAGLPFKRSLVLLTSLALLIAPSVGLACPSGSSNSYTYQGCCYNGPTDESQPVEHEFEMTGMYTELYSDTCNPDNSYSISTPLGPTVRSVTVSPWTTVCGVNYHADSISYFTSNGPENCSNCGFLQKIKNTYEDCSG